MCAGLPKYSNGRAVRPKYPCRLQLQCQFSYLSRFVEIERLYSLSLHLHHPHGQYVEFPKATTSMSGVCSIWHIHHPRGQVTLGAIIELVSPNPSQMKFAKCAASPSSLPRMRYSQCAASPSSLLRDEVYPVCGEPLIPFKDEV